MGKDDAMRFARNSTRPWHSLDSYYGGYKRIEEFVDSKEQILRCCSCGKSECDNCLAPNYKGTRKSRITQAREIFLKYFYEGLSRKEIMNRMNISETTYLRYQRRFIMEGE